MDTSYLFSELLLVPGTLVVFGISYYVKYVNDRLSKMVTEDDIKKIIDQERAVLKAYDEGFDQRLDRLERLFDRIEDKLDDIYSK